jgi:hypothetical protein
VYEDDRMRQFGYTINGGLGLMPHTVRNLKKFSSLNEEIID